MRVLTAVVLAVVLAACGKPGPAVDDSEVPNPASVYCEEQGGTVDVRAHEDGGPAGHLRVR